MASRPIVGGIVGAVALEGCIEGHLQLAAPFADKGIGDFHAVTLGHAEAAPRRRRNASLSVFTRVRPGSRMAHAMFGARRRKSSDNPTRRPRVRADPAPAAVFLTNGLSGRRRGFELWFRRGERLLAGLCRPFSRPDEPPPPRDGVEARMQRLVDRDREPRSHRRRALLSVVKENFRRLPAQLRLVLAGRQVESPSPPRSPISSSRP